MGGAKKFRPLWSHYYQGVQGVIFVIDTSDKLRMVCVKDELKLLLEHKGTRRFAHAHTRTLPQISLAFQSSSLPTRTT